MNINAECWMCDGEGKVSILTAGGDKRTAHCVACTREHYGKELAEMQMERDALAAQVTRMRDHAEYWINAAMPGPQPSEQEYNTWLATGHHSPIMHADPEVSLARRDARMKAEALEEFENRTERFGAIPYSDLVRRLQVRAYQYRQQAEGDKQCSGS